MHPNNLEWRQEVIGQLMPSAVALILALFGVLTALCGYATLKIQGLSSELKKTKIQIDDNHAETLAAVKNGPANEAARAALVAQNATEGTGKQDV